MVPSTPAAMATHEIAFEAVGKRFARSDGDTWAVKDLTFAVDQGEMVAVVGQTGCGKSTAFNLLLGLLSPTNGTVRVRGRNPHEAFDSFRGEVAVVFQDDRLLPWRSAVQNVCLGLEYLGVDKAARVQRAMDWLHRLGLGGHEDAYPYQLSGGMRQRVGIARCFATDPSIILCDESFSALDELTADGLRQEFTDLVKDEKKTGLFITHSIEEALTVGDRVLVLRAPGHVAADMTVPDDLDPAMMAELREQIRTTMAGQEGSK